MNIIDMLIGDIENAGVFAVSIVEDPAIQEDFVYLSKQTEIVRMSTQSDEKRILLGAALIPDLTIPRLNADGSVYHIRFSADTIREASQLYAINGFQSAVTLEHEKNVDGLTVVESWIIEDEDNDKSRKYGMNLPVGTWMLSMKVNNDEIWNDYVKTGKVNGFSIEGKFTHDAALAKLALDAEQALLDELAKIIQSDLSDDEMVIMAEEL
jgi:hypothetical protein